MFGLTQFLVHIYFFYKFVFVLCAPSSTLRVNIRVYYYFILYIFLSVHLLVFSKLSLYDICSSLRGVLEEFIRV